MKSLKNNSLPIVLLDIDYTLFDTDLFKQSNLATHSLYGEVADVLEKLSEIAILGIFSEGELVFQQTKLEKTGIRRFFATEHIRIVGSKNRMLKEILHIYKNDRVFLVDDRLEVLKDALEVLPTLFTIWIKRGRIAQNQKPIKNYSPHAIIHTLEEVVPLIASTK